MFYSTYFTQVFYSTFQILFHTIYNGKTKVPSHREHSLKLKSTIPFSCMHHYLCFLPFQGTTVQSPANEGWFSQCFWLCAYFVCVCLWFVFTRLCAIIHVGVCVRVCVYLHMESRCWCQLSPSTTFHTPQAHMLRERCHPKWAGPYSIS